MENYKEKYEQAFENLKKIKAANKDNKELVDFIEYQYPELKENEDERIRKEIMDFIDTKTIDSDERRNKWFSYLEKYKPISSTSLGDAEIKMSLIRYISELNQDVVHLHPSIEICNGWIAWLEKQGEQKPVGKIEPKFKVGDWVVQGKKLYQIEKVTNLPNNHFQYWTTDGVWFGDGTEAHLWTIQDAKDGDVLANENMVLIFKCFEEPSYRQHIIAHIGLDTCGYIQITNDSWNLGLNGANPATKEQRDLLFQKMKEVGYEWDAEKKKLKKIEQKPAAYFYCKYGGVMPLCSDCKRNHRNSSFKTKEITTWFAPSKSSKYCIDYIQQEQKKLDIEEIIEQTYHDRSVTDTADSIKRNSIWSEEDEKVLETLINNTEKTLFAIKQEERPDIMSGLSEIYIERLRWLKSLKQRMKGE